MVASHEYLKAMEEDAKERSKRREAAKKLGKEHKRLGNLAFKQGDFKVAIALYSKAIKQIRCLGMLPFTLTELK